jgi:DNA repair protein RadD
MALELRPYQEQAVSAVFGALDRGEHPVVSIATGGGKSLIAAAVAARIPGRVLVVTHRQELLEQNGEELLRYAPGTSLGYYSAGLGKRDISQRVIMGGLQSIYGKAEEIRQHGRFEAIVVDEAHAVPPHNIQSMYRTLFEACPDAKRIGMSATPYRLDNGPIFGEEHCWFDTLAYEASISSLTPEYLAPLRGVRTAAGIDVNAVRIRAGEFVESDLSQAACEEVVVEKACDELCRVGISRKAWIVFCVDVAHTELVTAALQARGIKAVCIVGDTGKEERIAALEAMRHGTAQALVNCMVATTGFNIRHIDLVAMLRPTMSKNLVVQMCGRGSRQADGKQDCVILDFAENISRHKPLEGIPIVGRTIERIAQDKEKEEASEREKRIKAEREAKHHETFSDDDPFSPVEATAWYRVGKMSAKVFPSKNPKYAGKNMVSVSYLIPDRVNGKWVSTFLCIEYAGRPRDNAIAWLRQHGWSGYVPHSAREIVSQWRNLLTPTRIQVVKEGKWDTVTREEMPMRQEGFWG